MSTYVNVNDPPGQCYLEGLSISNGFSSGYNEPQAEIRTTWGMSDNFTKTFGNHTLTSGGNFYHQFAEENTLYPALPIISFGNQYTGFGLSDFLLGDVTSYEQGGGETIALKGWQVGLFAQDQFRVRPDLTLTVGMRSVPERSGGYDLPRRSWRDRCFDAYHLELFSTAHRFELAASFTSGDGSTCWIRNVHGTSGVLHI